MTTKLDFYRKRKSASPADTLRDHLDWAEDQLAILHSADRETVETLFARLDQTLQLFRELGGLYTPNLRPEQTRLDTLSKQILRHRKHLLQVLGGPAKLASSRPAYARQETHPWWFVDIWVAVQAAATRRQLAWVGGILGVLLVILTILFNTILKPDPALVARMTLFDEALALIVETGDYEQALANVDEALTLRPQDAELMLLKSIILDTLEQSPREAAALNAEAETLLLNPEDRSLVRGRLYLQLRRPAEAVTQAETALNVNAESAEAWLLLGQSYAGLGRASEAHTALQQAADLALAQDKDELYAIAKMNQAYLPPNN